MFTYPYIKNFNVKRGHLQVHRGSKGRVGSRREGVGGSKDRRLPSVDKGKSLLVKTGSSEEWRGCSRRTSVPDQLFPRSSRRRSSSLVVHHSNVGHEGHPRLVSWEVDSVGNEWDRMKGIKKNVSLQENYFVHGTLGIESDTRIPWTGIC